MQDVTLVSALAIKFQAACNASQPCLPVLPMQLSLVRQGAQAGGSSWSLQGMCVRATAPITFTPLHRARVYECVLSASLMQSSLSESADGMAAGHAFRQGLLTVDQTRAAVPLLTTDPLVRPQSPSLACMPIVPGELA